MNSTRRIAKNTFVLLLGRFSSQAFGIFYVAALARYIHASGMGQIATATSLVAIIMLITDFGLGQVIIRDVARDRAKASFYVSNALILKVLLSIFCWIIIFIVTTY